MLGPLGLASEQVRSDLSGKTGRESDQAVAVLREHLLGDPRLVVEALEVAAADQPDQIAVARVGSRRAAPDGSRVAVGRRPGTGRGGRRAPRRPHSRSRDALPRPGRRCGTGTRRTGSRDRSGPPPASPCRPPAGAAPRGGWWHPAGSSGCEDGDGRRSVRVLRRSWFHHSRDRRRPPREDRGRRSGPMGCGIPGRFPGSNHLGMRRSEVPEYAGHSPFAIRSIPDPSGSRGGRKEDPTIAPDVRSRTRAGNH